MAQPPALRNRQLLNQRQRAESLMRCYTLQREQWVASPLQRIFPFFAQPENLALITPPSLGFRLLTPLPVEMEKGRIIDYTIRVIGLPIRWRTLITTYIMWP